MMIDTVIRSRAYLLTASDIDTDQVFPSRFQNRVDGASDLSDYFFHDQRFEADGTPIAGAALNDPALKGACVLVAPRNYACGSARPGAVFAHRDFGIRVLISEFFGQVFPTVCYKFGVVPIELPRSDMAVIVDCLSENPLIGLEIDFATQEIKVGGSIRISFGLDEHVRAIAISGQDELGLTLTYREEIERYEAERFRTYPWLVG
ncbi:MAG: hypothetical protein E5Y02_00100 [Mesorhizobium sp.]|nr:MAG: hypothetical protein E5Y02_00100 [Mesorhizobium sp.]